MQELILCISQNNGIYRLDEIHCLRSGNQGNCLSVCLCQTAAAVIPVKNDGYLRRNLIIQMESQVISSFCPGSSSVKRSAFKPSRAESSSSASISSS